MRKRKKGSNKFSFADRLKLEHALNEAKGPTAESNLHRVLSEKKPDWLYSFEMANYNEDHKGIDCKLIVIHNGHNFEVPIQIKTSKEGLFRHIRKRKELKKNGSKSRYIPVAILRPEFDDDQILKELLKAIGLYLIQPFMKRVIKELE